MSFDGTNFKGIDSEAYSSDRPLSTVLAHESRNQLINLGEMQDHSSMNEREPGGSYPDVVCGSPATWHIHPRIIDPNTDAIHAEIPYTCTDLVSDGSFAGEAWLELIKVGGGPLRSPRQDILGTGDLSSRRTLSLTIPSIDINETELGYLCVCFWSKAFARSESVAGTFSRVAFHDTEYEKHTWFAQEDVEYDSGLTARGGGDIVNRLGGRKDTSANQDFSLSVSEWRRYDDGIWERVAWRPQGVTFREERSTRIEPIDGVRPNIPPYYNRGGGQSFRLAENVFPAWKTQAIGPPSTSAPSGWTKPHRHWRHQTLDSDFIITGDNCQTAFVAPSDEFEIRFHALVIGWDETRDESAPDGEGSYFYDEATFDVDVDDFTGSTVASYSETKRMRFHQVYHRQISTFLADKFGQTLSSTNWDPYREGRLYIGAQSELGQLDDRTLAYPLIAQFDVSTAAETPLEINSTIRSLGLSNLHVHFIGYSIQTRITKRV